MKTIIHHIDLSLIDQFPEITESIYDHYIVLWWKSLPLGDFYLKKEESQKFESYILKVIKSIENSIASYILDTKNKEYIKYLQANNLPAFKDWMNDFLEYNEGHPPYKLNVSVIICTRSRPLMLKRCLNSLMGMIFTPSEIIVVDNAPDKEDTKLVCADNKIIKYVAEPRKGLDIARNTGIRNATNEIIAFIDDDAIAHQFWLLRVSEAFRKTDADAITGLVFPTELVTEAQKLFEAYWSFNRGFQQKVFDNHFIDNNYCNGAPVWEIGAGVNMAFKKKAVVSVGLFDEILDAGAAGCNGDSEIWFRLLVNGYKIIYYPKAVVYHEHRCNMSDLEKQVFNYMKGNTTAALVQNRYHPKSKFRRYIQKNIYRKTKSLVKRTLNNNWSGSKILRLELSGIFSGILYYYNNGRRKSLK